MSGGAGSTDATRAAAAPTRGAAAAPTLEIPLPGSVALVAPALLASGGAAEIIRGRLPRRRFVVITDDTVRPLHAGRLTSALGADTLLLSIAPGEARKTRATWADLTDRMLAAGIGRDGAVVAVGGGVVGDLAGFVAATYMRGVPVVQVPTTLLAMIDASIGGKTGVDTPAGKNLVGAFHQPAMVLVDPDALATLPVEQLRAGLAEALKHGIIADAGYLERTVSELPLILGERGTAAARREALTRLILRSVEIKADVVRRDEREQGVRATLNFGHTIGHAVEALSGWALLHGEAVAIGMVLESVLAERAGIAEGGTAARVRAVVERAGLPVARPASQAPDDIVRLTHADKKAREGQVEYALPARVGAMSSGTGRWTVRVPDDLVREVLA